MIACSLRTVVSTYLIFMYSGCRPNLYQRGCNRLEGGEIVNPFMSCPIVLSSFSCFQSQIFLSSLRCSLSLAISSRVNLYLFCVFLWINILLILRYSSRQSIRLLFLSSHCALFPSGLYLMIILELLLSSILSARPAPFNSSYFFWCCIWFLVAVSFFWLLHSWCVPSVNDFWLSSEPFVLCGIQFLLLHLTLLMTPRFMPLCWHWYDACIEYFHFIFEVATCLLKCVCSLLKVDLAKAILMISEFGPFCFRFVPRYTKLVHSFNLFICIINYWSNECLLCKWAWFWFCWYWYLIKMFHFLLLVHPVLVS